MFEDFGFYEFIGTAQLRMPYRLLTPIDLYSSSRYPLVVFFHGSGERGDDNEKQLLYGMERFAKPDSRSRYPCFVLAPQCPTHLGNQPIMWTGEREGMHLLKLAPEVAIPLRTALELMITIQEKFPVDMGRVYVTGISMGGFATWEALIRHPQKFAAAIPVCGGGDANHADRIRDIPVWAFHGANDSTVPVECSRSMIKMIEKAGGHPRYTEYPGVGHNSWDRAYAEPELLSWLFSQNRDRPQQIPQ
ncbi:MAG: prolyl oligopeptidase family serine peptidase [Verrucomicrobia bacterium]|nr:prolyl oligopeptidase family serine peptidase [Verrucomicrobiota bacterium]